VQLSKNVSRGVTYVVVVVAIVVAAQFVAGDALGSSPVYVVVSKSMVPTLQIGDIVITQRVQFSSIHVGQVIVFVAPDSAGACDGLTVVHRVVAITSQGLITQGDDRVTNPHPDEPGEWPPVPAQCVRGVVFLAVPYLGLISMLIPYPWNYALVGLILVFVFLSELGPTEKGGEKSDVDGGGRARVSSESGQAPPGSPSPSPGTSQPS